MEVTLQTFDPWGVQVYNADMRALFASTIRHETRTYVLPAGEYHFTNWTATILSDHTRAVPDSVAGGDIDPLRGQNHTHVNDCTLALVGDSVTFGHGVSDGETFANGLARRYPDVHILNASLNGYNIEQAYAIVQNVPADGYLYVVIGNDANPTYPFAYRRPAVFYDPLLPKYLFTLGELLGDRDFHPDYALFQAVWERLRAHADVLAVGFEGDPLATWAGVPQIPYWTRVISMADGHANAEGQIEILRGIAPYFETLIERTCPT